MTPTRVEKALDGSCEFGSGALLGRRWARSLVRTCRREDGASWVGSGAWIRSSACPHAAVAPDQANYPVLVFSPAGSPPHSYMALLFRRYPELRLAVPAEEVRWGSSFLREFARLSVLF